MRGFELEGWRVASDGARMLAVKLGAENFAWGAGGPAPFEDVPASAVAYALELITLDDGSTNVDAAKLAAWVSESPTGCRFCDDTTLVVCRTSGGSPRAECPCAMHLQAGGHHKVCCPACDLGQERCFCLGALSPGRIGTSVFDRGALRGILRHAPDERLHVLEGELSEWPRAVESVVAASLNVVGVGWRILVAPVAHDGASPVLYVDPTRPREAA